MDLRLLTHTTYQLQFQLTIQPLLVLHFQLPLLQNRLPLVLLNRAQVGHNVLPRGSVGHLRRCLYGLHRCRPWHEYLLGTQRKLLPYRGVPTDIASPHKAPMALKCGTATWSPVNHCRPFRWLAARFAGPCLNSLPLADSIQPVQQGTLIQMQLPFWHSVASRGVSASSTRAPTTAPTGARRSLPFRRSAARSHAPGAATAHFCVAHARSLCLPYGSSSESRHTFGSSCTLRPRDLSSPRFRAASHLLLS